MAKEGMKTSEFWMTLLAQIIAVVVFVLAGVLGEGHWVVAGVTAVSSALAAMGYSAARAKAKAADSLAHGAAEAAAAPPR